MFDVPCGRLRQVLSTAKDGLLDGRVLLADRRIPRSRPVEVRGNVVGGDPTRRIVTRYRVAAIDQGTVRIERLRETRYDGAGQRIADLAPHRRRPPLALQFLALAAMVGLLGWVVNRSRPELAPDPLPRADEDYEEDGDSEDVEESVSGS